MDNENRILNLSEKVRLLARDIYDTAILQRSLKLEYFVPSKQIQNLLDEEEFERLIIHLRQRGVLPYMSPAFPTKITPEGKSKGSFQPYDIRISEPKIRRLLGLKDIANKPAKEGIKLHPKLSYLIVNGVEIPLGKGELHKSIQYWVCRLCLKKPNIPVKETDIMAKYKADFDITGRGRAVRDAVYKLNPKIKNKTGIDKLFSYSTGHVTFNADKLK
jgi:hypothetical protein